MEYKKKQLFLDIKSKKKYSNEENPITKISKDQIKNTIQTKLNVESLDQSDKQNLNKENITSLEKDLGGMEDFGFYYRALDAISPRSQLLFDIGD